MTSPSERTQKPKLSKARLEKEGVFFFENVCRSKDLENWILPIRDQVTRLRRELPNSSEKCFCEEFEDFKIAGHDSEEAITDGWSLKPAKTEYFLPRGFQKDLQLKEIEAELQKCAKAAKSAVEFRKSNQMEPRWTYFLQKYIFRSFHNVYPDLDSYRNTFQRWELHENLHWNEFSDAAVRELTGPKPDLTFAFPIIDTTKKENRSYLKDLAVESFSLPVLSKLRSKNYGNLKSAPTTKLQTWAKEEYPTMNATDMICFPWAIVEVKKNKHEISGAENSKEKKSVMRKNKTSEQFCYCQAANASYSALTMREELVAKAKDRDYSHDGLVIFAFTCVGPSAKLWITYRKKPHKNSNRKELVTMRCIWATSLELTWGVMALRWVVDNVREWVYTRVKPEIVRWVRMVHSQPSQRISLTPNGEKVVQRRRASSCEPLRERPNRKMLENKNCTPISKATPALLRGNTSPRYTARRILKYDVPKLRLNDTKWDAYDTAEEIEGDSDEAAADEGYVSEHTSESSSEKEEEDDDEDEQEDDEEEDEDEYKDEDEDEDEEEDEEEYEEDEGEDSEEEYIIDTQHYKFLRPRFKTNCGSTEDAKLKEYQRFSSRPRRRSSRF